MNMPGRIVTRKPLSAEATFADISSDEEYEQHLNREKVLAVAFSMTAGALVELGTHESGYRMPSVDRLHVAATMDGFVYAAQMLKDPRNTPEDIKDLKKGWIIPFNHAIGSLVDNDPAATQPEVLTYLDELYRKTHPDETLADYTTALGYFRDVLKGMTQENVAEQLANYLGYEVEPTSVDDEVLGVDRYFGIDGRWEPVDVKSSEFRAAEARTKDFRGRLILCTHVDIDNMGGGFRLPEARIPRYAQRFQQEIFDDWDRVQTIRTQRSRGNTNTSTSRKTRR